MLTCTGDIYIICLLTSVYSRFSFSPFSSWNLFLAATTTTSITLSSIFYISYLLSLSFSFLLLFIYITRLAILSSISLSYFIYLSFSLSLSRTSSADQPHRVNLILTWRLRLYLSTNTIISILPTTVFLHPHHHCRHHHCTAATRLQLLRPSYPHCLSLVQPRVIDVMTMQSLILHHHRHHLLLDPWWCQQRQRPCCIIQQHLHLLDLVCHLCKMLSPRQQWVHPNMHFVHRLKRLKSLWVLHRHLSAAPVMAVVRVKGLLLHCSTPIRNCGLVMINNIISAPNHQHSRPYHWNVAAAKMNQ